MAKETALEEELQAVTHEAGHLLLNPHEAAGETMRLSTRRNLLFPAFAAVAMGFLFAYWDSSVQSATHYSFMDSVFPWLVMIALFLVPNIIIDHRYISLGIANTLLGVATEDMAYWFWQGITPASWSPLYPVWHGIPLDDVIWLSIALFIYQIEFHGGINAI
ncbi:MAG: hypothetical protein JRM98_05425 [Nitrososphaerota archaeon]|nr:hypothetical protein [Nitrososphaerota archaeon]